MHVGDDPNAFWQSVHDRYPDHTAILSADGQDISFAKLERAIANIADLLVDYGAGPGARVACTIPNFAVVVASWFATWRIGGHVMAASNPAKFVKFGLSPEFTIGPPGATFAFGSSVPLHANSLIDEPGAQVIAPSGKTYFNTANTPRDSRAIAVGAMQLVHDGRLYADLLGPPKGGVYMTTGLSSLRAMRDMFRAFEAGMPVIGGDVAAERIWPLIAKADIRELMVSPLSLHLILKHAPQDTRDHAIDRVFVAAGTAQSELLARAHGVFGDVIELGAGSNETSVYAWKKYEPSTHKAGDIGQMCCGIKGEVRDAAGQAVPCGTLGQLALWVPQKQRFEGYINANQAYDMQGWVSSGFLGTQSSDGTFTKLGRTDDRINLGGTRLFAGKVEAELERLPTVTHAVVIRVFADDGAEALGVVVQPGPDFDAAALQASVKRSLRGIGEVFVRPTPSIPMDAKGQPDRVAVEQAWPTLLNH